MPAGRPPVESLKSEAATKGDADRYGLESVIPPLGAAWVVGGCTLCAKALWPVELQQRTTIGQYDTVTTLMRSMLLFGL